VAWQRTRPSRIGIPGLHSFPLSLRMWSGTPSRTNRSLSRSKPSSLVSFLDNSIARHSRVNSSTIDNIRNDRPSAGPLADNPRAAATLRKAPVARHLPDRLGETHGPGGGRVSARVPGVRRRHPTHRVHHRSGTDPEDPHASGRAARTAADLSRPWPAHRLGRALGGIGRQYRARRVERSAPEACWTADGSGCGGDSSTRAGSLWLSMVSQSGSRLPGGTVGGSAGPGSSNSRLRRGDRKRPRGSIAWQSSRNRA
jgi:hypothetical protein